MAEPETIEDRIKKTAVDGIQSASQPGESASVISINDLIAAEKHLAGKDAAKRNHLGMHFRRIERGGTG